MSSPAPTPVRLSWRFSLAMAVLWLILQLVFAVGAFVGVLAVAGGWICLSRIRAGTGTAWHVSGALAATLGLVLMLIAQALPSRESPAPTRSTEGHPTSLAHVTAPIDPPKPSPATPSMAPPPPGFKVLRQPTSVPAPPPGFKLENPTPATTGCPTGYIPDGRYCLPASERDN
jgi:hypothetical protein